MSTRRAYLNCPRTAATEAASPSAASGSLARGSPAPRVLPTGCDDGLRGLWASDPVGDAKPSPPPPDGGIPGWACLALEEPDAAARLADARGDRLAWAEPYRHGALDEIAVAL